MSGIEQIIAHFVGDYIFQTDKQAQEKRKSQTQASIHALTYTFAFLPLTHDLAVLSFIWGSHALIDHYGLARYVVRLKNSLGDWGNRAEYATATGYKVDAPSFLSVWLLIIADNTLHLLCNYVALNWIAR